MKTEQDQGRSGFWVFLLSFSFSFLITLFRPSSSLALSIGTAGLGADDQFPIPNLPPREIGIGLLQWRISAQGPLHSRRQAGR